MVNQNQFIVPGETLNDVDGASIIDPAIEVERRKGFDYEARGYQLKLPNALDIDVNKLVATIQEWATSVKWRDDQIGIEFGGGVFKTDGGELVIQGEFPPNKFNPHEITSTELTSLVEALIIQLKTAGFSNIEGGAKTYLMTPSIEGFIGLEPGYTGAEPHSFEDAVRKVSKVVELYELPKEAIVFYNYRSGENHVCCTEAGIHIQGSPIGDLDQAVRTIAAALEQTSIHFVVCDSDASPPLHLAWKIKGLDTAREAAAARAKQAAISTHPHVTESDLRETLGSFATRSQIDSAINFISASGHRDRERTGGGNDLTEHIYPIARDTYRDAVRLGWSDKKIEVAVISALLHDYLEDINKDGEAELKELFGDEITHKVLTLSWDEVISMAEYFELISKDDVCSLIKICDRDNNHKTDDAFSEPIRIDYRAETVRFILPIAKSFGDDEILQKIERHLLSHLPGKIRARDPIMAATLNGGCTFEPDALGWWTYIQPERTNETRYGLEDLPLRNNCYGVFIPTITKTGRPVDAALIESLIEECASHGLIKLSPACGMWCLSTDDPEIPTNLRGTAQSESVWIASTNDLVDQRVLFRLAFKINQLCEQDCVAYETNGQLRFVENDSTLDELVEPDETIEENFVDELSVSPSPFSDTLIVLPANDAEAFMLIDLARSLGIETVISRQPWGASWIPVKGSAGLEEENLLKIETWKAAHPNGVIYGFELKECPEGVIPIDGKTKEYPSSLLMLAENLGISLNNFQRLVAVNRAADPRSMYDELRSQQIDPESPYGEGLIRLVMLMNRTCQGITPSDEAQALRDLDNAERRDGKALVRYSTPIWTPQADRLFMDSDINEHLHIPLSAPGRWVYYGGRVSEFVSKADEAGLTPLDYWYREPSEGLGGYFGLIDPSNTVEDQMLDLFWKDEPVDFKAA